MEPVITRDVAEEMNTSQPQAAETTAPAIPLAMIVAQIRRDSQDDPQQYLDETAVPFGGE